MIFESSQTAKNLKRAFLAECRCCVRYIIYSRQAKADGFEQIAEIFRQTAANDMTHAKLLLGWDGKTPGFTSENLSIAHTEKEKLKARYAQYSITAVKEGYNCLAKLFERLADIEQAHRERFFILRENMDTAKIFCKDRRQTWVCRVCGHESRGQCSDRVCPVCGRQQAFTQIKGENY